MPLWLVSQGCGDRRPIPVVSFTEPADPADGVQALLKCREPAIHGATHAAAGIMRTPRIVLRLGAGVYRGCRNQN